MLNAQPQLSTGNRAYVLIDVKEDSAAEVAKYLREDLGLATVDVINGPYRVIAVVEGRSISSMARTIVGDMKRLSAVRDIVVYMSVPEEKTRGRMVAGRHRKGPSKALRVDHEP